MSLKLISKKVCQSICYSLLAFLLLLSPCKLRHYVQAQVGASTTQTLNKSKSSVVKHNCYNSLEDSIYKNDSTKAFQLDIKNSFNSDAVVIKPYVFQLNNNGTDDASSKPLGLKSPIYILYSNLLIYA